MDLGISHYEIESFSLWFGVSVTLIRGIVRYGLGVFRVLKALLLKAFASPKREILFLKGKTTRSCLFLSFLFY